MFNSSFSIFWHCLVTRVNKAKYHQRLLVKIVETDVIIIAVAAFHKICGLTELLVEFGVEKTSRFIPVHKIASGLGKGKSNPFLFFRQSVAVTRIHLLWGSKMSYYPGASPSHGHCLWKLVFVSGEEIQAENNKLLERYFVVRYSPTCNTQLVNFALHTRSGENMPQTTSSKKLHVLRAALKGNKW